MLTRYVALSACLLSALVVGSAGSASAQDPTQDTGGGPARNFGRKGQWAFSSDNTLSVIFQDDSSSIAFAPAADYFVIDNLSVGGFIGFDYTNTDPDGAPETSTTRFSIGPRVGYNLSFTNLVGIWPKIGFSFAHSNTSVEEGNTTVSTSNNALALNLFVPVMFHPTTHFFVGLGPFLDTDLSGSNRVTQWGLKLTVGGWLD